MKITAELLKKHIMENIMQTLEILFNKTRVVRITSSSIETDGEFTTIHLHFSIHLPVRTPPPSSPSETDSA